MLFRSPLAPGSADCEIWKMAGDPLELEEVTDFEKTVYNLSETLIPQVFIVIVRTKYGKWVAVWHQKKAKHIDFTLGTELLTSNASIGNVTVDVDGVYDGCHPDPDDGKITIWNKTTSVVDVYMFEGDVGDKGSAVLNERLDHYIIRQMECP